MTRNKKDKRGNTKKVLAMLLPMLMVATMIVTYAFWAAGVNAPMDADSDLTVQIGDADDVDTIINLSSPTVAGRLIPQDIPLSAGEVHSLTFVVDVEWAPTGGALPSELDGVTATLTANATALMVGANNLLDATGRNGDDLFIVDITPASTTIGGNGTVPVTIVVSMNQPLDRAQYNLVANQAMTLNVNFAVTNIIMP